MSRVRLCLALVLVIVVGLLAGAMPAGADTTAQSLPFAQDWTNIGLITIDDNWSGVPGVIGYRGDGLASSGADPQTVTADGSSTPVDVNANRASVAFTTGGVTEFELSNAVVALQGSGTADAPHLVLSVDTTGATNVVVSYNLRDIDDTADNAVQQVALQYQVGSGGSYTNLPTGYVADATTGPSLATQVTPVSVTLPANADNQPLVQIRVITADAAGSDEWVGVDDISVTGSDVPPPDAAPFVASTSPPNGASGVPTNSNVEITFSESVSVTNATFTISCATSGGHTFALTGAATTYVLNPDSDFVNGETCTVTVDDVGVSDSDSIDPPDHMAADYTFTFTTQGQTGLRIHDIQGRQHLSPYRGSLVAFVPGVVTARRLNGFYYQDPQPDSDPRTSEGIFVFTGGTPPSSAIVGEPVTVSGRVTEFRGGCNPACEATGVPFDAYSNLTLTEITSPVVTPGTETGPIPPTVVGAGGRTPPVIVIDNDTLDPVIDDPATVNGNVESKSSPPGVTSPQDPTFDPAEDGLDFHESLEGMLVQVNNAVAVSPTVDFSVNATRPRGTNSEIPVLADNGANAQLRTLRGGIILRSFDLVVPQEYRLGDFNPERLILNDPPMREQGQVAPLMNVRDRFAEPVRAIVDYSFGNFKYLMLNIPPVTSGGLQPEVTRAHKKKELSIATYNVENLDPLLDSARMPLIARQIIDNLRSPDLLALVEMQDFDGEGPGGPAGDPTFAALSAAITAAGGPTYQWRQIDPVHNADGGVPNGNIRVGFMFRTDRGLSFVDRPGGTAVTATEDNPALPGAQLTFSPGRIEPTNTVWANSRKPLAGEFRWKGTKLFVVANHFNSKTGDGPTMGRFQEPIRPTEVQRRGTTLPVEDPQRGQAGVVNGWVKRLLTADRRANVVVLGDLNDFHFSDTNRVVERGRDSSLELISLWHFEPRADRYSYIFQGNSQDLDHILVSPHLLSEGPQMDPVHINSEFWSQISDHDSLVARVKFGGGGHDDDDDDGGGGHDDDDDGGHDDDDDDGGGHDDDDDDD